MRTGLAQVPYSARGWIHKAGNDGFIKVVADADRSVLVGATSAGPWGGEVLSALQVAIRAEVPLATLRNMPYAYPTFYRAIEDALRSWGILVSRRPAVVAFDVIETLMSLEPLRARLADIGQPPGLLEAWYTRTLRDGMALSATGDYVPFSEVAEAALRGLTHYTVSDEQVAAVMAGLDELPAFPDAVPAVTRLTEAGLRVACLTNGSAYLTSSFVNRTGLGSLVDRVISVQEVYRWKPAGVVYLYAASVMDVPTERMALVAAHDWDCHGAKRAGLTTGWVSRKSGGFGAPFAAPDVAGEDLTEVAAKLLALEP